MASILGTRWTIRNVTEQAPFRALTEVEITLDAKVKFDGQEHQGTPDASETRVTVNPLDREDEHWEFVASEPREIGGPPERFFVMYGCSWKMTKPDAMGAWGSDPQGTP